jgi:hypothetical protein
LTAGLITESGKYGGLFDTQAAKGIQQLIAEGATPDEAIEIALAAMQSGQGARGIAGVAGYRASVRQAQEAAAKERAKGGRHKYAAARDVEMPPAVKAIMDQAGRRDYGGVLGGFQTLGAYEAALGGADKDALLTAQSRRDAAEKELERTYLSPSGDAQRGVELEKFARAWLSKRAWPIGSRAGGAFLMGDFPGGEYAGTYKTWRGVGLSPEHALGLSIPPWYINPLLEDWKKFRGSGGENGPSATEVRENSAALRENSRVTRANTVGTIAPANPNAGVE